MNRVLVIGCSGAGKSTLARRLGEACGIAYVDTDSLYWQIDWTPVPVEEVIAALPLDSERWVIDGNFASCRDQVWAKADCIVWLNYPRWRVLWRISKRNLKWWMTRRRGWSGNQMSLARALSGIRFSWQRYAVLRRSYPEYLEGFEGKAVYVFRTPRECNAWLKQMAAG